MRDENEKKFADFREVTSDDTRQSQTPENTTAIAEGLLQAASAFALCPLDGRYVDVAKKLAPYFSEYALVKNRVKVEVCWLRFLLETVNGYDILDTFDTDRMQDIMDIYENFSYESYKEVKDIEKVTNHDVKACELFVADKLKELGLGRLVSYVHIGCTSEDITNPSYARMITDAMTDVLIPTAEKLIEALADFAYDFIDTPMLAHTHGQPATPTTVGKEFMVYVERFREQLGKMKKFRARAKFNGASGNYAAISVAFPEENWPELSSMFVRGELGLRFNPVTTQIESHDYMVDLFDTIRHFNNILLDFDLDCWMYISKLYFKQIAVKNEVGSSTMPHKINPIRFENSEANITIANALLEALSNKLPRSRWQRDLSDSSTQRNIGLAFGYTLQAFMQTLGGLKKVAVNTQKINEELENNWAVLAEPIQTVLRKYGIPNAYNQLKELTRGKEISKEDIQDFIKTLDVLSDNDRSVLINLTPASYVGLAAQIVEDEL